MNAPLQPNEEQIAAAQLRIELDKKLGRETPEIVREIATYRPTTRPTQHLRPLAKTDQYDATQAHPHTLKDLARTLERDEAETLLHRLAAIHRQRDEAANAIARWRAAQPPQEPELLNNLALTLRDVGRKNEAIDVLREALTISRQQRTEADEPSTTE